MGEKKNHISNPPLREDKGLAQFATATVPLAVLPDTSVAREVSLTMVYKCSRTKPELGTVFPCGIHDTEVVFSMSK